MTNITLDYEGMNVYMVAKTTGARMARLAGLTPGTRKQLVEVLHRGITLRSIAYRTEKEALSAVDIAVGEYQNQKYRDNGASSMSACLADSKW